MRKLPPGVQETSGGKFEPDVPNVYFLAGTVEDHILAQNRYTLLAVNEINSARQIDLVDRWCDERSILLDSGVYALASAHAKDTGKSMTEAFATPPDEMDGWNLLYDKWCALTVRFGDRLWGAIELDQGGREAVQATRAQSIKDTGIIPIPVYHAFSDGWDYYDTLASTHDRVCYGGLLVSMPARVRLCWTAAERARAYPYLWTHLLGVSPAPWVTSLGMRGSVDSSGWLGPCRWSASWRSWSMLQRMGAMPNAMTYLRGSDRNSPTGFAKAKRQMAASATFQQETLRAVREDTHPGTFP